MSDEEVDNGQGEIEPEYDPDYPAIVNLPIVDVSTNEENEELLFKIRAKLYRWVPNADPAEWKERGTGELKILRNKDNNNVRVVMRRDKTLKVCANHFITPWMELVPKSGSDKAFIYSVLADFADEEARPETFAIKFGSLENANLFLQKIDEAKEILRTRCNLYNGVNLEDITDDDGDDDEDTDDDDSDTEDIDDNDNDDEQPEGGNDASEVSQRLSELNVAREGHGDQ